MFRRILCFSDLIKRWEEEQELLHGNEKERDREKKSYEYIKIIFYSFHVLNSFLSEKWWIFLLLQNFTIFFSFFFLCSCCLTYHFQWRSCSMCSSVLTTFSFLSLFASSIIDWIFIFHFTFSLSSLSSLYAPILALSLCFYWYYSMRLKGMNVINITNKIIIIHISRYSVIFWFPISKVKRSIDFSSFSNS